MTHRSAAASGLGLLLATLAFAGPASSQATDPASGLPEPLRKVGFEQRIGETVPLDLGFRDHTGADVTLDRYFGERPVVLALVYYDCPMLCTMVLNGLTHSLRTLNFDAGREFEVLAVSFDARETPALAAERRDNYVHRYGREGAELGWSFLTGDPEAIESLTESVGFRFTWDEASEQFAHASGIVVLTPEGRVARYFFGVEYPARDLRLGLVEAAENRLGTVVDQILLYCYQYDPSTGRYSAAVMNIVRLAGIATLLSLVAFLTVSWRRERRAEARA